MSEASAVPEAPARLGVLAAAALYCAWATVAANLISIAAAQILLGLSLATLLLSGTKLRLPRIWLPLAVFMAGTILSLALSDDPLAGRPQIRKFFVYLTLLVVFSNFRRLVEIRRLVYSMAAIGGMASGYGMIQFAGKVAEAHARGRSFYEFYVGERITGFMSHWMTFSGELMIVLLLACAFLMFSPHARKWTLWLMLAATAALAVGLVAGYTRGIWIATACSGVYLVWVWKRRLLAALPALVLLVVWLNPGSVRTRFDSLIHPAGRIDSNQHRIVCWRTGWQMVRAHPWFGVGPEMVGKQFMEYLPPDIHPPLPTGWYGHLHSIYVHYAAERGIPTMLALVWALFTILWDFGRGVRRLPPGRDDRRFILHGAIAVVIAIMISGISELNLGDSEVLSLFLGVTALGYVALEAKDA
jgi:putative inorganic carbon (hco3(-)) transporter